MSGTRVGRRGYTLLAAATMSRLADNTTSVALVLLVIARTHDARFAGLLVAAFTVPTLLAGPVLGAYLDRLRHRRLLFAGSQAALALDLAAVLVLAGHVPGWLIAALALVAGVTSPVLNGGYSSLIPQVIPAGALGRANALDAASYGLAGIAGPAIVAAFAGALGATAGFAALVAITVAGVPLLLVAPMPAAALSSPVGSSSPAGSSGPVDAESLAAAIADGLRLLRRSRELLSVTIATTGAQFCQGPLPVVLPLLALALGRTASGGGWLIAAFSVGGLLGALASDRLIGRLSTRPVMIGSFTGTAGFLALLAVTPSFTVGLAIAVVAGIADGPSLAATLTVRQGTVPANRYAQVQATAASLKIAAFSAGSAAAGLLTGVLTARELLAVLAVGQLLCTGPLLSARAVRSRPGPAVPDIPNGYVVPADSLASAESTVTAPEA